MGNAVTVAKALLNKLNEGYAVETFVGEGYGYFDDAAAAIAQALNDIRTEALEEAAWLCRKYAHSGGVSEMRRQVAYACERRIQEALSVSIQDLNTPHLKRKSNCQERDAPGSQRSGSSENCAGGLLETPEATAGDPATADVEPAGVEHSVSNGEVEGSSPSRSTFSQTSKVYLKNGMRVLGVVCSKCGHEEEVGNVEDWQGQIGKVTQTDTTQTQLMRKLEVALRAVLQDAVACEMSEKPKQYAITSWAMVKVEHALQDLSAYVAPADEQDTQLKRYREALKELCEVKIIKDVQGETGEYCRRKPKAWEAAFACFPEYVSRPVGDK